MGNCDDCSASDEFLFECRHCGGTFCEEHAERTDHDCRATAPDGPEPDDSRNDGYAPTASWVPTGVEADRRRSPRSASPDNGAPNETQTRTQSRTRTRPLPALATAGSRISGAVRPRWTRRPSTSVSVVVLAVLVFATVTGTLWLAPAGEQRAVTGQSNDVQPATSGSEPINASRVARLVHEYSNAAREADGAPPMTYDPSLAAIAQSHSEDMATVGYAGHRSPDGETVGDRFATFGYDCAVAGEIVQYARHGRLPQTNGTSVGSGTDDELARAIVANWNRSDRHAAFLRNDSWTAHGVGIAVGDEGTVYVTQNTCAADRTPAD